MKFVVLDDVAYSGDQLIGRALYPLRNLGVPQERIFVGTIGMAQAAFYQFQRVAGSVYAGVRMPSFDWVFPHSEGEALARILLVRQEASAGLALTTGYSPGVRNLTFPWYKAPDNFLFSDYNLSVHPVGKGDLNKPLGNPLHSPNYRILADIVSAARLLW